MTEDSERHRKKTSSFTASFPRRSQRPGLGHAVERSQELHPRCTHGQQAPKYLDHLLPH